MARSIANREPPPSEERPVLAALLFSDIRGYSKLNAGQLKQFYDRVLPRLAERIQPFCHECINTWGDAIYGVYKNARDAADAAQALREYFTRRHWESEKNAVAFPEEFAIRIALHTASVYRGTNPITHQPDAFGTNVTHTARIEPIVVANEIWVTEAYKNMLENEPSPYVVDALGARELVKGWGEVKLYRLREKNEILPPVQLPAPVEQLAGPRAADAIKKILERIIENSKKPNGYLCIAGIAHRDLFGNALGEAMRGLLNARATPIRVLYLDPQSPAAFAREVFENQPNRRDQVATRDEIKNSVAKARTNRDAYPNLFIRMAGEMPSYSFFNQEEMLHHPYLNSAVGADTRVTLAPAGSPTYAHARDHFENHWRGRWALMDLGNVLIRFDHKQISAKLWKYLGDTQPNQDWPNPEVIHEFFFGRPNGGVSRNEELEIRAHDIEWLHGEFCEEFRCEVPLIEFRNIWNDIFAKEHPEARKFIRRMQAMGISVGICSNTNESHWAWIEQKYPDLVGMVNRHFLSFRIKARKPATEFFDAICRQTHVPPWHHVLVDDLLENVTGARLAGMRAVQFIGSYQNLEQWTAENHWDSTFPADLELARHDVPG
jgi:HAD superfamily hydrolase (TIGR01509 family)